MLSICIPIYNFNVSTFVKELSKQSGKLDIPSEIILIDDCSAPEYKKINELACKRHRYIELDKNIGRAKIRNLFLSYVNYEHLLFIDCDSSLISDTFLSTYIQTIKNATEPVICGGSIYDHKKPAGNKILRWKYGIKRETTFFQTTDQEIDKGFMTNNFLISKKLFEEIKFDERIRDYGHEDTLFGYELKRKGIKIKHINNPVLNSDIDDNVSFLEKTKQGILNLVAILAYVDYNPEFIQEVSLLRFYEKLNAKKLIPIFGFIFNLFEPSIKYLLIRGYVNLYLFDFYKLGLLIRKIKNH